MLVIKDLKFFSRLHIVYGYPDSVKLNRCVNLSQMSPLFEEEEYCIRSFQPGSITIRCSGKEPAPRQTRHERAAEI